LGDPPFKHTTHAGKTNDRIGEIDPCDRHCHRKADCNGATAAEHRSDDQQRHWPDLRCEEESKPVAAEHQHAGEGTDDSAARVESRASRVVSARTDREVGL
jgi:hypothetical protein